MPLVGWVRKVRHNRVVHAFIRLLVSNAVCTFVHLVLLRLPWDASTASSIELWFSVHPILEITEFIEKCKKPIREALIVVWINLLFILGPRFFHLSGSLVTSGEVFAVSFDLISVAYWLRRHSAEPS